MSTKIQGFVSIPSLADNSPSNVSVIGEIGPVSSTYAREKQFTAIDSAPGIELIIFKALNGNAPVTGIDEDYTQDVLELLYKIKKDFTAATPLSNFLQTHANAKFSSFSYGNIILKDGIRLPETLSFTHSDNGGVDYTLWLSDAKFELEYEGVEVFALPPCLDVKLLYGAYATAKAAVDDMSYTQKIEAIGTQSSGFPYTKTGVYQLKWNDPTDLNNQITLDWTIIGYGKQSLRTDHVLASIRAYLLANHDKTIDEWKNYLPDVTTLNIINVIPLWDQSALQAGASVDLLYRPLFKIADITTKGPKITIGRTSEQFTSLSESLVLLYKNLPVVTIAGESNDPAFNSFGTLFPDYTILALNDQNANSLTAGTRDVIQTLDTLARAAEIDDGTQTLQSGITRNLISGVTFIEKQTNNLVYRMVTRASYLAIV